METNPPPALQIVSSDGTDDAWLPYCTVRELLRYHGSKRIANLLFSIQPRHVPPSFMAMCDPNHEYGEVLRGFGHVVTGQVECACAEGGLYSREFLRALEGSTKKKLNKLVADLWFLRIAECSGQASRCPWASDALGELAKLKVGGAIFGLPSAAREPLRGKPGRKADPKKKEVVKRVEQLRAEMVPWKNIPALIKKEFGQLYAVGTLRKYLQAQKNGAK